MRTEKARMLAGELYDPLDPVTAGNRFTASKAESPAQ